MDNSYSFWVILKIENTAKGAWLGFKIFDEIFSILRVNVFRKFYFF